MKILMYLKIFICLILSTNLKAQEVDVSLSTTEALIDETVQLVFKINGNIKEEPYIAFNPGSAEVLGKKNGGVSISTTIINGRVSTKKEMTIVYDLTFSNVGTKYIKDIKIDLGNGIEKKVKPIKLKVLRERAKPPEIFVMAIPTKSEVYVGEGFDVNYYLYSRVNTLGAEVEEFPKLNKFTKRFRMVREVIETVRYKGLVYRRQLKYSARLFPEKVGKAKIDPLRLRIQYISSSRSRRFGGLGLGFGFGGSKIKSMRSRPVSINVLPLPTENVPKSFTGLVGEHQFKLSRNRDRFLVNEAIEVKLEVEGVGALEHMNPPKLYFHNDLEEFDTKSELVDVNNTVKKRVFDYTYLARAPFEISAEDLEFSYFDPEAKMYITTKVTLPEVRVGGKAVSGARETTKDRPQTEQKEEVAGTSGIVAPIFSSSEAIKKKLSAQKINIALLIAIIFLSISIFFERPDRVKKDKEAYAICKKLKKSGLNYSTLHQLLIKGSAKSTSDLKKSLKTMGLERKTEIYFLTLLDKAERANYKDNKKNLKFDYNAKHFSALLKSIDKVQNEASKHS